MKVSELIKKLRKSGCYLNDHGKDHGKEHDEWYNPITGKYFRIPRHKNKELATGTVNSILKDAGLK